MVETLYIKKDNLQTKIENLFTKLFTTLHYETTNEEYTATKLTH